MWYENLAFITTVPVLIKETLHEITVQYMFYTYWPQKTRSSSNSKTVIQVQFYTSIQQIHLKISMVTTDALTYEKLFACQFTILSYKFI